MPVTPSIGSGFPVARCDRCDRTVVTCVTIDEAGAESRACAHCDTPIASEISWVSAQALEEAGYEIGTRAKPRGCGCGSGGCALNRH